MESEILDTVIGIVFVWFLLSAVLSLANEAFALITRARAKHLWLAIGKLTYPAKALVSARLVDVVGRVRITGRYDVRPLATSDEVLTSTESGKQYRAVRWATDRPTRKNDSDKKDLRESLQPLYKELAPELIEIAKPGRRSKVTAVPSEALSDAIVSVARNVRAGDVRAAALAIGWTPEQRAVLDEVTGQLTERLTLPDLQAAAAGKLSSAEIDAVYGRALLDTLTRDLSHYFSENAAVRKSIRRAIAAVGIDGQLMAAKKAIESSFEREMDQLSVFYRRQTRKILALLAVPLVLFTHSNAITTYDALRNDATLRSATLASALAAGGASSVADAIAIQCAKPTTRSSNAPSGTLPTSTTQAPTGTTPDTTEPPSAPPTSDPGAEAARRARCASGVLEDASQFRVGLAWQELIETRGDTGKDAQLEPADALPYIGNAVWHDHGFLGRSITLIALLFGAQFWFDVLRRLTGLRTTLSGKTDKK